MYDLVELENDIKLKGIMEQYLDKSVKNKAKYDDFLGKLANSTDEFIQGEVGVAFHIDFVKEIAMRYNKDLLRKSVKNGKRGKKGSAKKTIERK